MIELTEEQKALLLLIGKSHDPGPHVVDKRINDELLAMGLIYLREDGSFYFTREGDKLYNQLSRGT